MPITAIDPGSVRKQSTDKKQAALAGVEFSDFMGAATAPTAQTVAITKGYQPAAITSAAMSGVAGTPDALSANSPYFYGNGGSLVSSAVTPTLGLAGATYGGGYGAGGLGGTGPGGTTSINGLPGVPSQDYLEKQALFQKMNDSNWEMLVAQVQVNNISRDYQARSNILKTKSDTELNAVRNMRA